MRSILQRSEPRPMINSVPPRNGEGDRPKGGGGAGAGLFDADRAGNTSRAPPPCFAWSPSPCRGGAATIRSPSRLVHQRSEEHTSELQSLMRLSYAVFYLKKKKQTENTNTE